ncbi:unnamed protein product [Blepharisma stoltei]|uniref:Malectin domain-containing protein n=1 Tax=Blepharisma stoltei TaxID=1481888 RepID=A0AAU9J3G2_9CILI|nr:unnamed protein product [Blepharisma stoltei]
MLSCLAMIITNMSMKFLIILGISFIPSFGQSIYAVNCGGEEYIDSSGVLWLKDQDYKGGVAISPGKNKYVKYTKDPTIYQTERYSTDNFSYRIPLPAPGSYIIILKFAEFSEANIKRQFNIALGSNVVIYALDIYDNVKDSAAYDIFIPITVTEDKIYWYNTPLLSAVENDKILINFNKTRSNPKVSGIMLFKGILQDTDYYEQDKRIKHYKQLYQNKQEIEESNSPYHQSKAKTINTGEVFTGLYVIKTYPMTLMFSSILFYIIFQKLIPKAK